MTEPVYFVVERGPGGTEMPAIYFDLLPDRLKRKPSPIIYVVRLDTMRGAHRWLEEFLKKPLAEIYAEYCRRRDGNELPPANLADPPRATEKKGRILGEWWEPPRRTWSDRPPDTWGPDGKFIASEANGDAPGGQP